VGGVGLSALPDEMRAEVLEDLRAAAAVTVRDHLTQAHLQGAGIHASLLPDPAVMVAELFGELIGERSLTGETARAVAMHPAGFLAAQCSAEFAADASLDALAQQVQRAARAEGLGVVLLRAGAAPWHDDLATLRRLAERLPGGTATVFESLDVWDICALIAASRGVLASSLHAQIVAAAFGRPCTRLRSPAAPPAPTKHEAYAQTWASDDHESEHTLSLKATRAKDLFRRCFAEVVAALEPPGP
jgi:polysaccharide pyruvyl transferase WcaK-like protein